jgi:hypothetical protein
MKEESASLSELTLPTLLKTYLKPHQETAIQKMWAHRVCRGMLPTGSGKTAIEAGLIIQSLQSEGTGFGVYVVLCPRIMLTTQLCVDIQQIIGLRCGIRTHNVIVNSGGLPSNAKKVKSLDQRFSKLHKKRFILCWTPNTGALVQELVKAKDADRPICIFGTYQSAAAITQALRSEQVQTVARVKIGDESQFLVSPRYRLLVANDASRSQLDIDPETTVEDLEAAADLPAIRRYYLTATEKVTGSETSGLGNDNLNRFGPRAVNYTLRQMVEADVICAPRVGRLRGCDVAIDGAATMGFAVQQAFREVDYHFTGQWNLRAKMLVNTAGSQQMLWFLQSKEYGMLRQQGVNIAVVSSNAAISNNINGVQLSRAEWLSALQDLGETRTDPLIVMHHDILTVGIDVPGLNSICMLHYKDKIAFLQSLGRILRKDNIKPYGLVVLPDFQQLLGLQRHVERMIGWLLEEGFKAEQLVIEIEVKGKDDTKGGAPVDEKRKPKIDVNSKQNLTKLTLHLEKLRKLDYTPRRNLVEVVRDFNF